MPSICADYLFSSAQPMLSPSDAASQIIFQNHLHIVGACVLFYDHMLTLENEINYLWKRRKLASAYWFFAIRYFSLASNVAGVVYLFKTLPSNLSGVESRIRGLHLSWPIGDFRSLHFLFKTVVMILRIYCLWERSKRVLSSLAVIGAILTGAALTLLRLSYPNPATMQSSTQGQKAITITGLAGSWGALFIFDSIVFGLTIVNGWKMRRRMGPDSATSAMPLRTLIVRDGALYFAVMLISNLVNILTFFREFIEILHRSIRTSFPALLQRLQIGGISITMMARLILNLHAEAEGGIFTVNHMDVELEDSMLSDGNMPFASRTEIENSDQSTD
ncbi:hypothetical protein R3P38DRAFT_3373958 [Favolaschia claudopus]|uniref:DUF6533 domain-containing protein n=1 Tax=Favolaschia claudopus TaxID=2862362 RepID=A0AAV9ZPW9_9AGAR